MTDRINKLLHKLNKNKYGKYIVSFIIYILDKIDRSINYFKKDSYIHINYYHERIDGENKKFPDSFSIYICQRNKCESHFGQMEWEEVQTVLDTLRDSKGHVLLEVKVGLATSKLLIPKWAKQNLIDEIEKEMSLYK